MTPLFLSIGIGRNQETIGGEDLIQGKTRASVAVSVVGDELDFDQYFHRSYTPRINIRHVGNLVKMRAMFSLRNGDLRIRR